MGSSGPMNQMGSGPAEERKWDPDGFEELKWDPEGGNQTFPLVIGLNSVSWDGVLISKPRGPVDMANLVSNGLEYAHSDDKKICTCTRNRMSQLGTCLEKCRRKQTHVRYLRTPSRIA